jgi:2-oxoglutarate ferredoxin oxidoreductase subunit alpha
MPGTLTPAAPAHAPQRVIRASQHTVEVVSDPGEGAQKCGQIFGRVSAMMGNGTWTVEIIPAEIQPPPRTPPSPRGTACASAPDR